jgi:lantibiotic modifying enzyme
MEHTAIPVALDDIARALAGAAPDDEADLARGDAGVAVFHAFVARAFPARYGHHLDLARQRLEAAEAALVQRTLGPGLYHGIAGIGWAGDRVRALAGEPDPAVNEPIDDVVARYLAVSPWPYHYDLVEGLVGLGVYALGRIEAGGGRDLLAAVVQRLEEIAVDREGGGKAFVAPGSPGGEVDLGLAHGMPGVIALLAACARQGLEVGALLDACVGFLLRQPRARERAAWCYGDPGVAAALLQAARARGDAGWEAHALELARSAAARPMADCGVQDAGLCHGAAGLAHIFGRLHRTTDDPVFADAARRWLARALEERSSDAQLASSAGFYCGDLGARSPARGFIAGAAGIGLAFAAALTPLEPMWDRALLLG